MVEGFYFYFYWSNWHMLKNCSLRLISKSGKKGLLIFMQWDSRILTFHSGFFCLLLKHPLKKIGCQKLLELKISKEGEEDINSPVTFSGKIFSYRFFVLTWSPPAAGVRHEAHTWYVPHVARHVRWKGANNFSAKEHESILWIFQFDIMLSYS